MIRACIRRPVAITMLYAGVATLGAFAWSRIPIELMPETDLPRLDVFAAWRGASTETVEAFLTAPLEGVIQQVRGAERIMSTSVEGSASIEVEFGRDVDMDFARLDLSERIAALEEDLPPGVSAVRVETYVPEVIREQARPFLEYTLTGPYTLEALRAHLDDVLTPALSEIDGVGLVRARGGRKRRLEVRVDPAASRALGLPPDLLAGRIAALDLVREAGAVYEGASDRTVTISNRLSSPADILDAVVATAGGRPVRVRDVATISDTYEEANEHSRIDGRPAVTFEVVKAIGINTVAVADRVKARMAQLERLAPYGSRYILLNDESEQIRRHLSDLGTRAGGAALVIFFVLLGFLGSFVSAVVVFSTIVFSILIALNLVYFGGLSLNLLTLMGLAMGFGLLVDNCIVVLENVYRRWSAGEDPGEAAAKGASEVFMPLLASTGTNLIVLIPFVYFQGEMRLLYVPLVIVVGLSQLASLLVGFSYIPALSAYMLSRRGQPVGPKRGAGLEATLHRPMYTRLYATVISWTIRNPWVTVTAAAALFGSSAWLFGRYVTRGAIWTNASGMGETFISVEVALPRGSSLERTDELVTLFERKLAGLSVVDRYVSQVGREGATIWITFPESLERTSIPLAVKDQMFAYATRLTGAEVRIYGSGAAFSRSPYGGEGMGPNYAFDVLGYNYKTVHMIAETLGSRLARVPRVEKVDVNAGGGPARDRSVQYVVEIDRAALARYDVSVQDIVMRLGPSVGGNGGMGTLKLGGEEVQYRVKLEGGDDTDVLALLQTLITLPDGRQVRSGDLLGITVRDVPTRVLRENQQYRRTVTFEFRGPARMGAAVRDTALAQIDLPPGYTTRVAQGFRLREGDRRQIFLVLAAALLLIYMLTSAVFESLRLPLSVLPAIPMGLVGIFLTFLFTKATFTREAYIGVIMTGGVMVNHAILLVAHIGRVRTQSGFSFESAVLVGTLERVRPILMTGFTTVFGMLPLVVLDEAPAAIWNALALTMIGGMLSSTALVLTVVPALYVLLERGPVPRRVFS